MKHEPNLLRVSFEEAEVIAADLVRVWTGMTGMSEVPTVENVADLVQRTLRKTRELIAERKDDAGGPMHIPENEIPY